MPENFYKSAAYNLPSECLLLFQHTSLDSYPNYQDTQQADINRENALKLFKRLR